MREQSKPTEEELLAQVCEILGERTLGKEQLLDDLASWDSIAIELIVQYAHSFGGEINLAALFEIGTVGELLEELEKSHD